MSAERLASKLKVSGQSPGGSFGESPQEPFVNGSPAGISWTDVVGAALTAEAEQAGLLSGDKSQHVTFRAPPALVAAAKRNSGVASTSELGMLALMMLAAQDPVVEVMRGSRGALGQDHTLDY